MHTSWFINMQSSKCLYALWHAGNLDVDTECNWKDGDCEKLCLLDYAASSVEQEHVFEAERGEVVHGILHEGDCTQTFRNWGRTALKATKDWHCGAFCLNTLGILENHQITSNLSEHRYMNGHTIVWWFGTAQQEHVWKEMDESITLTGRIQVFGLSLGLGTADFASIHAVGVYWDLHYRSPWFCCGRCPQIPPSLLLPSCAGPAADLPSPPWFQIFIFSILKCFFLRHCCSKVKIWCQHSLLPEVDW